MSQAETMRTMPWITWLDLDTELAADGTVRAALRRPKPEHLNHNGHVNAAVAYGVAEVAGAGAAVLAAGPSSADAYTVIRTGTIEYRRPARDGITATSQVDEATAQRSRELLVAGDGADIDVEVVLEDAAGEATGRCTFVVSLRPRRAPTVD